MAEQQQGHDPFKLVGRDSRLVRLSHLIPDGTKLDAQQREEIRKDVEQYMSEKGLNNDAVAKKTRIGKTTLFELLTGRFAKTRKTTDTEDRYMIRLHNWKELHARRDNLVKQREFVDTSVAQEILTVAEIVAESGKIGIVYGPAQIGKSFTLKTIAGDDRFGRPIYIAVDQAHRTPSTLCRLIATNVGVSNKGLTDSVFERIVLKMKDADQMLMFDEADRLDQSSLELIRDLHDKTGCPILLAGKPCVYQKFGFNQVGDFNEVLDQFHARTVIRRDLTERTRVTPRGKKKPPPLFSKEDILALVKISDLRVQVDSSGIDWLQGRASTLGFGGIGMTKLALYLADKLAVASGKSRIGEEDFNSIESLLMGREDAPRIADAVAEPEAQRIRKLA